MVGDEHMINTVIGPIETHSLGTTFIHEHLYVIPNELRKYEDYTLDDIYHSIAEVMAFKQVGGNTIVDLTPINYGRNPLALKMIAEATGVNVLFVTGFHKEEFQPKWLTTLNDNEVFELLYSEITRGVTSQSLLPGAMKVGTSKNEVTFAEQRILAIAGQVQKETGIPIITHCDDGTMGLEQIDYLTKNGANASSICLSHVDLTKDFHYLAQICETGASICIDHIGRELTNHDADRVQLIKRLVDAGYENQICLSGDMGRKKYLPTYGGTPGLTYILTSLKEELLKVISETAFNKMIKINPIRILSE